MRETLNLLRSLGSAQDFNAELMRAIDALTSPEFKPELRYMNGRLVLLLVDHDVRLLYTLELTEDRARELGAALLNVPEVP